MNFLSLYRSLWTATLTLRCYTLAGDEGGIDKAPNRHTNAFLTENKNYRGAVTVTLITINAPHLSAVSSSSASRSGRAHYLVTVANYLLRRHKNMF